MEKINWLKTEEAEIAGFLPPNSPVKEVDLTTIQGKRLISTKKTLHAISKCINEQKVSDFFYLGSGDYHHLTLSILEQFGITENFTLILFDHHHDGHDFPYEEMVSCGSWLNNALETTPFLKEILITGVSEENAREGNWNQKIRMLTEEEWTEETVTQFFGTIQTQAVYVSIDRDLLATNEVLTDWDQGTLSLAALLAALSLLLKNHTLIGADICGDVRPTFHDNGWADHRTVQKSSFVNEKIFNLLSR